MEGLHVPSPGAWRLTVVLEDAAGNLDQSAAGTLDSLRLDTDQPTASFRPFDPADPTRVRIDAQDDLSGVAAVEVEAEREGSGVWSVLSGSHDDNGFSAVVDDALLPAGKYLLRAHVTDGAGNERTITSRPDGSQMEVKLPLRNATRLTAGRPYKRAASRRTALDRTPELAFGATSVLRGRLVGADGKPRADAPLEVIERSEPGQSSWRHRAKLVTAADGTFVYEAAPGHSREIRFRFAGTPTTLPATADVQLGVRAGVTLTPIAAVSETGRR